MATRKKGAPRPKGPRLYFHWVHFEHRGARIDLNRSQTHRAPWDPYGVQLDLAAQLGVERESIVVVVGARPYFEGTVPDGCCEHCYRHRAARVPGRDYIQRVETTAWRHERIKTYCGACAIAIPMEEAAWDSWYRAYISTMDDRRRLPKPSRWEHTTVTPLHPGTATA